MTKFDYKFMTYIFYMEKSNPECLTSRHSSGHRTSTQRLQRDKQKVGITQS